MEILYIYANMEKFVYTSEISYECNANYIQVYTDTIAKILLVVIS